MDELAEAAVSVNELKLPCFSLCWRILSPHETFSQVLLDFC